MHCHQGTVQGPRPDGDRCVLPFCGIQQLADLLRAGVPLLKSLRLLGRGKSNVRIAVVTNSTYDGLCYNAEKIKAAVANQVDALHFDEAWYAYAAFHEFYAGRHAMMPQDGARHQ